MTREAAEKVAEQLNAGAPEGVRYVVAERPATLLAPTVTPFYVRKVAA